MFDRLASIYRTLRAEPAPISSAEAVSRGLPHFGSPMRSWLPTDPTDFRRDQIPAEVWPLPFRGPLDLDDYGCETPEMRRAYREVYRRHPDIQAAIEGKVAAVACLDVSVLPRNKDLPADQEAAQFVKDTVDISARGWEGLIEDVARPAFIDGFSVGDIVLSEDNGRWGLKHVRSIDTTYVRFQLDEFRNITAITSLRRGMQSFDPAKTLIFTHKPLFANPFGQADMRAAYKTAIMIEDTYLIWQTAIRVFGAPIALGKYSKNETKSGLETALKMLRAGGYIAMPDGADVTLLNMASATSFDAYERKIDKLRERLFLAVRGAYLPFMQGSGSGGETRGNADTSKHAGSDPREYLIAKAIARTLTMQLVPHLVRPNFGPEVGLPRIVIGGVDWDETKQQLEVAKLVVNDLHLAISKKHVYEISQFPPPSDPEDELGPPDQPAPLPPPGGGMGGFPGLGFTTEFRDRGNLIQQVITDKNGVQRHVWVSPDQGQPATNGQPAGDAPAAPASGVLDRTKAAIGSATSAAGQWKQQVGEAWTRNLDRLAQTGFAGRLTAQGIRAVGHAAGHVHRGLMLAMHTSRGVAVEAARKRGLSDDQTANLSRVLAVADFLGGYAAAPVAGAVGGLLGPVGATAGAKVGMFLPTASVAYIAYSTARDPIATWAAARKVMGDTLAGRAAAHSAGAELADALAELLHTAGPEREDWAIALVLAGLASGKPASEVVTAAQDAIEAHQSPPDPGRFVVADVLGIEVEDAGESFAAPGPPPRPGLVWKEETHRWINPETDQPEPDAGQQQPAKQPKHKFDPKANDPGDYIVVDQGDLDWSAWQEKLGPWRAKSRETDLMHMHKYAPVIHADSLSPEEEAALEAYQEAGGEVSHLDDDTGKKRLFWYANGHTQVAIPDVPPEARNAGVEAGGGPADGWDPAAVTVYRRLSPDYYIRREGNAVDGGTGEAYSFVHKDDMPEVVGLPEPFWDGFDEDLEDDFDSDAAEKRKAKEEKDAEPALKQKVAEAKQSAQAAVKDLKKLDREWDGLAKEVESHNAKLDKLQPVADEVDYQMAWPDGDDTPEAVLGKLVSEYHGGWHDADDYARPDDWDDNTSAHDDLAESWGSRKEAADELGKAAAELKGLHESRSEDLAAKRAEFEAAQANDLTELAQIRAAAQAVIAARQNDPDPELQGNAKLVEKLVKVIDRVAAPKKKAATSGEGGKPADAGTFR